MEVAADALRGPDISLPGAVRWLRRRIRAVRTALAHVAPEIDLNKGCMLFGLRRSLSPQILNRIPAPLGFKLASDIGEPRDGNGQHEMGPDRQAAGQYGPVVYGNQARWNTRPNNLLQQPHPPPKICSGSGELIAACKTAAPAFTCNGSSASAPIARDTSWTNAQS
jgi:hypothetical protein